MSSSRVPARRQSVRMARGRRSRDATQNVPLTNYCRPSVRPARARDVIRWLFLAAVAVPESSRAAAAAGALVRSPIRPRVRRRVCRLRAGPSCLHTDERLARFGRWSRFRTRDYRFWFIVVFFVFIQKKINKRSQSKRKTLKNSENGRTLF